MYSMRQLPVGIPDPNISRIARDIEMTGLLVPVSDETCRLRRRGCRRDCAKGRGDLELVRRLVLSPEADVSFGCQSRKVKACIYTEGARARTGSSEQNGLRHFIDEVHRRDRAGVDAVSEPMEPRFVPPVPDAGWEGWSVSRRIPTQT